MITGVFMYEIIPYAMLGHITLSFGGRRIT